MTLDIFSKEHKKVGTLDAPESVFAVRWNSNLVRQVLDAYEANRRQPVAHTKGRGEVRGGGKKPYAQKHTGNSRQSSTRSPLWPGGGTTFGPSKDRNFTKKVNRKMKRIAMLSIISRKTKENEVFVVDSLSLKEPKTKLVAGIVKAFFEKPSSVLFVTSSGNRSFFRAAKNLPKTTIADATSLNAHECALRRFILIEQSAIAEILRDGASVSVASDEAKAPKATKAVKEKKVAPKKSVAKKASK